jgi:hypothetical protein
MTKMAIKIIQIHKVAQPRWRTHKVGNENNQNERKNDVRKNQYKNYQNITNSINIHKEEVWRGYE